MTPITHYDPERRVAFATDNGTVRLSSAFASMNNPAVLHIDIKFASINEPHVQEKPVYFHHLSKFDGFLQHPDMPIAIPKLNLHGSREAGFVYNKCLADHLEQRGYISTVADLNVYIYSSRNENIIITFTVDDFLTTARPTAAIGDFKTMLSLKEKAAYIDVPKLLLGRTVAQPA